MFDVITIGAGLRDVFLLSDQFQLIQSERFETGIGECVALGSKIEVDKIVFTTGGGATNAVVTFARLGFKTATICRVGDDSAGRDVLNDLKREHVDTSLVKIVKNGTTGYSTLLTASNGERTALTYRGVSAAFGSLDISWSKCKTRCFYVTSLGGNIALLKRIATHASAQQALLAWNPGHGEIKKGLAALRPILKQVDILILNKEEAAELTRKKTMDEMAEVLTAHELLIVITDGTRGAFAYQGKIHAHAATHNVKAISRTGAGDAFGSAFVAAYLKTRNLKTALVVGTRNAESVIQHIGAKAGILKHWPKT